MKIIEMYERFKWKNQEKFLIIVFTIYLVICEKEINKGVIKDYCVQYISEYKTILENEKGEYKVVVIAPDFVQIIETILRETEEIKLTREVVEKCPNYEKEYIFYSDSEEINYIEKRFKKKFRMI